jgi:hypothetical protein
VGRVARIVTALRSLTGSDTTAGGDGLGLSVTGTACLSICGTPEVEMSPRIWPSGVRPGSGTHPNADEFPHPKWRTVRPDSILAAGSVVDQYPASEVSGSNSPLSHSNIAR